MGSRMDTPARWPFFLRFGVTLLTIGLLAAGLYLGNTIILPFLFAVLLSTLLLPLTKKLQQWHFGKVLSIGIVILIAMGVIAAVVYFLSSQIANFADDFPKLQKRFHELVWSGHQWVSEHLNIGIKAQKEYLNETAEKMKTDGPKMVGQTFLTLTGAISYLVFLPIYSFLILYHKDMIKKFLIELCTDGEENKMREVLQESQLISQQYLTGLLIEMCIVFALNTAGFLILGIKYAIFLALLAAILNLVPYIGMIVANVICIIVTLMSSDNLMNGIWVMLALMAVQLIDNNILMPLIVGNKVKLNALAIIIGVLIAGTLAGVSGMFLAIPALAVMKLIFERVDHLKPWAILLGDETTAEEEKRNPLKRKFSRVNKKVTSKHIGEI
jgi:predicted PurR-regulated permease PerM